jgi:hypothetical protein
MRPVPTKLCCVPCVALLVRGDDTALLTRFAGLELYASLPAPAVVLPVFRPETARDDGVLDPNPTGFAGRLFELPSTLALADPTLPCREC